MKDYLWNNFLRSRKFATNVNQLKQMNKWKEEQYRQFMRKCWLYKKDLSELYFDCWMRMKMWHNCILFGENNLHFISNILFSHLEARLVLHNWDYSNSVLGESVTVQCTHNQGVTSGISFERARMISLQMRKYLF